VVPNLVVKEMIWSGNRITDVESVSDAVISFVSTAMAALGKSESRAGRKP
jgi:hypothetical protein